MDKAFFHVVYMEHIFGDQAPIGEVAQSLEAMGCDSSNVVDPYSDADLDLFVVLAGVAQATRNHWLYRGSTETGNTQEEKWPRSLTCLQTAVRMKSLR